MQLFLPTIAAQLNLLSSVLGVAAAVVLSFAALTLIASYYRFQHIVELAEKSNPEDMGASASEILRVQMARYLAGCARRNTSFSFSLIRVENPAIPVRMDAPVTEAVKQAARRGDIACVYDDRTVALFTEAEPEDAVSMLTRISATVSALCAGLEADQLRVGVSSYPGHGLSGRELMDVALQGLEETAPEHPVVLPEIVDEEEDDEAEEEAVDAAVLPEEPGEPAAEEEDKDSRGWKEKRKNVMLDELTGVLKPSAISAYMQRVMSELRRKKKKAALFCVGVNNEEHISRFHGEQAADDVLKGVSKILQDNLRADDLIGRHEKYAFLVLAQCSLEEAEIIGKRISTLIQQAEFESGVKKIKTTITLGVATYPEHGRNLHQLYLAGQKVLDHSRTNDIRAYAVYDPEIHDKVPVRPMKSIKSVQA